MKFFREKWNEFKSFFWDHIIGFPRDTEEPLPPADKENQGKKKTTPL